MNYVFRRILTVIAWRLTVQHIYTRCEVSVNISLIIQHFGNAYAMSHPEDRGSKVLRNVGIVMLHYTAS
jgi:hypothetical protein